MIFSLGRVLWRIRIVSSPSCSGNRQIHNHQIDFGSVEVFQCVFSVRRLHYLVARAGQNSSKKVSNFGLIVHHQYGPHRTRWAKHFTNLSRQRFGRKMASKGN